jgi:trans-aconitate methyltransferase
MAKAQHDWEIVARDEPYYGVLSEDKFLSGAITPEAIDAFYETGRRDIAAVAEWLDAAVGARPSGRVLELGCGVGRNSLALAEAGCDVAGYDISETMLRHARERQAQNPRAASATFATKLPDGPFDWLHSFIVLQHIPPAQGIALLAAALKRLGPRAFISVQVTIWTDERLQLRGAKKLVHSAYLALARFGLRRSADLIQMHNYDLGALTRTCFDAGFEKLTLRYTDHGGHQGVWILGRKER